MTMFEECELRHVNSEDHIYDHTLADILAKKSVYDKTNAIEKIEEMSDRQVIEAFIRERRKLQRIHDEYNWAKKYGDVHPFDVGDMVLLTEHRQSKYYKGMSRKFFAKRAGPYFIKEKRDHNCYLVVPTHDPQAPTKPVNIRQITLFLSAEQQHKFASEACLQSRLNRKSIEERIRDFITLQNADPDRDIDENAYTRASVRISEEAQRQERAERYKRYQDRREQGVEEINSDSDFDYDEFDSDLEWEDSSDDDTPPPPRPPVGRGFNSRGDAIPSTSGMSGSSVLQSTRPVIIHQETPSSGSSSSEMSPRNSIESNIQSSTSEQNSDQSTNVRNTDDSDVGIGSSTESPIQDSSDSNGTSRIESDSGFETSNQNSEELEDSENPTSIPPKRGRGRPKKDPNQPPKPKQPKKPKKKRGRPKKEPPPDLQRLEQEIRLETGANFPELQEKAIEYLKKRGNKTNSFEIKLAKQQGIPLKSIQSNRKKKIPLQIAMLKFVPEYTGKKLRVHKCKPDVARLESEIESEVGVRFTQLQWETENYLLKRDKNKKEIPLAVAMLKFTPKYTKKKFRLHRLKPNRQPPDKTGEKSKKFEISREHIETNIPLLIEMLKFIHNFSPKINRTGKSPENSNYDQFEQIKTLLSNLVGKSAKNTTNTYQDNNTIDNSNLTSFNRLHEYLKSILHNR